MNTFPLLSFVKRALLLSAMFGLALAASAQPMPDFTAIKKQNDALDKKLPQIGQRAPDFTAKDVSGKTIKLSDYKGKIIVLEAYESECPWVDAEYQSGAMQALQHQLTTNDVVWLILDPWVHQSHPNRTPAWAKKEWASLKMNITDWIVDDSAQSLSKRYGIRVTPQMVVIGRDGLVAYTGAIDNIETLDGNRRTARNYVRQAVTELIAGKKVSAPHVKPFGCMIMYPGMSQFQNMRPLN